jgi:hypothetical protein
MHDYTSVAIHSAPVVRTVVQLADAALVLRSTLCATCCQSRTLVDRAFVCADVRLECGVAYSNCQHLARTQRAFGWLTSFVRSWLCMAHPRTSPRLRNLVAGRSLDRS